MYRRHKLPIGLLDTYPYACWLHKRVRRTRSLCGRRNKHDNNRAAIVLPALESEAPLPSPPQRHPHYVNLTRESRYAVYLPPVYHVCGSDVIACAWRPSPHAEAAGLRACLRGTLTRALDAPHECAKPSAESIQGNCNQRRLCHPYNIGIL